MDAEGFTEAGVCGDAYQRLVKVIGKEGLRLALIDAVITVQDQGATFRYAPNGLPPTAADGNEFAANDGFSLGPYTAAKRRLDWYWVRNTAAGQNATVVVDAFGESPA